MKILKKFRTVTGLLSLAALVYAINSRRSHGTFFGVPFEFRFPTINRIRERWWNREDGRLLTPHVFGVGWSVNLSEASRRLGIGRAEGSERGCGRREAHDEVEAESEFAAVQPPE